MAQENLMYIQCQKGCSITWDSVNDRAGDYVYEYDLTKACFYAKDLAPFTTYTIKRYDTSTKFIVGISTQYLMFSDITVTNPFHQSFNIDSNNEYTFTTGDGFHHLVAYITDNSEYNTRIMLVEGSSIESYVAPTEDLPSDYIWHSGDYDTRLMHDGLPIPIEGKYIDTPYPPAWWYTSNNKLTNGSMPQVVRRGAFNSCISLSTAHLPYSCKSYGSHSFTNTFLDKVKIAPDSTYNAVTTFPARCEVEFYPPEP